LTRESYDVDAGDGLRLHVEASGRGRSLVLLHGFTGSSKTWEPLRETLETNFRVMALDLPGHGRSSAPVDPRRYSLRRTADDVARVLDELEVKTTALMGYSMGGRAALHFAASHPDRLDALVLESTSGGISDAQEREERTLADTDLADILHRHGMTAFVDRWEKLSLWESQSALPATARAELRQQRLDNDPLGLANSLRGAGAAVDPLTDEDLTAIETPALLIAGALDHKYVAIARHLERIMQNAQTVIVPDAGHAVHLERPRELAQATLEFLSDRPRVRDTSHRV
jgi:2-succinyl-6-hydroxy-2,4-cyclohexadiene-1-carboxylate synthase